MITPWNLKIFDAIPPDKQRPGAKGAFSNIVVPGSMPKAFMLGTLLATDITSIVWGFLIVFTRHSSVTTIISIEALFLASLILLILARISTHFPAILASYAIVLVLSVFLNVVFPGTWGDFGLLALCGFAIYRFPFRWSWQIAALSIIVLMETHGFNNFLLTHHIDSNSQLVTVLAIAAFICWIAWSRRAQHLLIARLQEVQKQLRKQMEHAEELAATRERVRIARDIHDVLAHSLTVLSIQVQAARQLVHQQPERLIAKLDDMATLLRESLAESRRVVSLWRETASVATSHDKAATRLQAVIDRFSERTGIRCVFEEEGTAQHINDRQGETLQYILQEALTNAHRHGSARHIWAELQWQGAQVTLHVYDDGKGQSARQPQNGTSYGHHGLQGMRERATALRGELQAGPQKEGGFAVTLSLPLDKAERSPFQDGRT